MDYKFLNLEKGLTFLDDASVRLEHAEFFYATITYNFRRFRFIIYYKGIAITVKNGLLKISVQFKDKMFLRISLVLKMRLHHVFKLPTGLIT